MGDEWEEIELVGDRPEFKQISPRASGLNVYE